MTPEEQKILEIVTAAANAGEPCPTNSKLADMMHFKSHSGPLGLLQRLQSRGLITLERFQVERRVTINATGRRTKVYNTQPHWRDIENYKAAGDKFPPMPRARTSRGCPRNVVKPAMETEILERVSRDPCFRCGTRGDVGCDCPPAGECVLIRLPEGVRL